MTTSRVTSIINIYYRIQPLQPNLRLEYKATIMDYQLQQHISNCIKDADFNTLEDAYNHIVDEMNKVEWWVPSDKEGLKTYTLADSLDDITAGETTTIYLQGELRGCKVTITDYCAWPGSADYAYIVRAFDEFGHLIFVSCE